MKNPACALFLAFAVSISAFGRAAGTHNAAPRSTSTATHHHSTAKTTGVQRDSHGRIKRSPTAKTTFERSHPCPSTGKTSGPCPGYVIDHRKALACGGADDPSN